MMNKKLHRALALLGLVPAMSLTLATLTPHAAQAQSAGAHTNAESYIPELEYDEYMRLGFSAQQEERYADAATYFRYALYAVPNDREATIAYWNAWSELQQKPISSSSITAVYEQYMEQGYDATDAGDYIAALTHFQAALQQRPGDYYATQAIRNVHTYINRGTSADSPTDVPLTYNIYPGERPYDRYMRLGYAAAQRDDFASAISYFRSALLEQPNDRQATIAYWNAVDGLRDGNFGTDESSAESSYDRFMRLGYDATERGDYSRALTFFENALAARPEDGYAIQAIRNVQTYISN